MNIRNLILLVVMLFVISDCRDDNDTKLSFPTHFDYRMTQDITSQVSFRDHVGELLLHVPYELSSTLAFDQASVLVRTTTGISGNGQVLLNIPTFLDTVFVKVKYPGVPSTWKVPVSQGLMTWSNAQPVNESGSEASLNLNRGGRVKGVSYSIHTLGSWDSKGRPSYLSMPADYIDATLLTRINSTLPEGVDLLANSSYVTGDDKSITMLQDADVWITFVSEGSSSSNALGYYVYSNGNAPLSASQISDVTVIFPNASFLNSGGAMQCGDKVYLGNFKAGQTLGWVLFKDGFVKGNVTPGSTILYSNQALNVQVNGSSFLQQVVLLNDAGFGRTILGFEDTRIGDANCDKDYNDVLFSISANPAEAIGQQTIAMMAVPKDTDGDGVSDQNDAYPDDPDRAHDQFFPSQSGFNTLAFEDLWPYTGDYDFNDLVMGYNVQEVLNASNMVVDVNMTFEIRAVGGSNRIGFAVELPIASDNLKRTFIYPAYGGDTPVTLGTESGQRNLIFPLFDDVHKSIRGSGGSFTNTVPGKPYITPVRITANLTFGTPVFQSELGSPPFNPFIYVNDRSVEVHLPNQLPTDAANTSHFGQHADSSDPTIGRYYLTKDNKPWALLIPCSFDYPSETKSIESAYNYFSPWAMSNGTASKDWYAGNPGYRNTPLIYTH